MKRLPYVAVFEDDVLLGKDAEKFLAEDTWLEERFDKDSAFIVRLETMFAKVIVRPDKVLNYEKPVISFAGERTLGDGWLYHFA